MSKITGKQRSSSSVGYDSFMVHTISLDLAASQTINDIASRIPLLLNEKVVGISAVVSGSVAGTCAINFAYGSGNPVAVAAPANQGTVVGQYPEDKQAVATNKMFSANQVITMTANTVTRIYNTAGLDVVWPAGAELTLRAVTNGSAAGHLDLLVYVVPVDQHPNAPAQYALPFSAIANNL